MHISMCMLGRILWGILKELPFALWEDKSKDEHKNLSGKDYALKKKREVIHAWTDTAQWKQLTTRAYWRSVLVAVWHALLKALAVGILTIVFTLIYVFVRDWF